MRSEQGLRLLGTDSSRLAVHDLAGKSILPFNGKGRAMETLLTSRVVRTRSRLMHPRGGVIRTFWRTPCGEGL